MKKAIGTVLVVATGVLVGNMVTDAYRAVAASIAIARAKREIEKELEAEK